MILRTCSAKFEREAVPDTRTDVVVVGAGNAALVAALSAREAGAQVIVLESASIQERGGNSRFSGGIFRSTHDGLGSVLSLLSEKTNDWAETVTLRPYSASDFRGDWDRVSAGLSDTDLVAEVIEQSFETLGWMKEQGVKWELCLGKLFDESKLGEGVIYDIPPGSAVRSVREGIGLMDDLFQAAEAAGIEIWYDAPAIGLLMSGSAVEGVRVRTAEGFVQIHGSVVLACGGFESNPEMRLRYLGSGWDLVKVRGTRFNMGTMLSQALAAGAQPAGHWEGCHAAPIDAAAPSVGDIRMTDKYSRYSYPYSVMVNNHAKRFVDEGEDQVWLTYAKTGSAIRNQPQNIAFQIFDQQTVHLLEPRYATSDPIVATDIVDLAHKLDLPCEALRRTIDDFNASIPDDAPLRFQPLVNDGVKASPTGQPSKSNWALRLDQPPYVVYPCACGITFTYGGLKIDSRGQVLDTEGRPMPGLFAAGEIAGGFFYFNYAAGSGLMRGAVFGRISGANAASLATTLSRSVSVT
jgi:tricarballylate dehydrogenase